MDATAESPHMGRGKGDDPMTPADKDRIHAVIRASNLAVEMGRPWVALACIRTALMMIQIAEARPDAASALRGVHGKIFQQREGARRTHGGGEAYDESVPGCCQHNTARI